MSIQADHHIKLRDGRSLGYAQVGDPQGTPVFHFHGWPGSRLEAALFADAAATAKVRLIGIDRPGVGLSTFKPGRQILDWPGDVIELANQFGIGRFAVQGWSGGGPFVAACAYQIPHRLTACGIVGGMGPIHLGTQGMMGGLRMMYFVAQRLPWLAGPLLWLIWGRYARNPAALEARLDDWKPVLPEPDRRAYANRENLRRVAASMVESFRQGSRRLAYEARLLARPWGFDMERIRCDRVFVWHGELDQNVPAYFGRLVGQAIPGCMAVFYPDEAHLSIIVHHANAIVSTLIAESA